MKNLIPIGRFSTICRLSVKALRYYDELGLLHPAVVDPDSGYRYYSLAQAVEAEAIRLLRSLDMPLDEIRELLRERDSGGVRVRLDRHRSRIEKRLAEERRILAYLERLMEQKEEIMPYEVKVKELSAQPVISIRTHTPIAEMDRTMGEALGELFGYLGQLGARPAGPVISVYHDPEFKEGDVDVEICIPVEQSVRGRGRITSGELVGGPMACTLHAGPYSEIGPAYQALAGWMQAHGHETSGPPREAYLVGPDRARDPAEYRTEVVWPIRRTDQSGGVPEEV